MDNSVTEPVSNDHLVEVQDLTKRFPAQRSWRGKSLSAGKLAVDGVSLRLHHGEIFGLVGPNGAGKTTLIKLLTTLLVPTSGSARIAGLDVVADEQRVRRLVGLVTSNERSFFWRLTARENLLFFASLYDMKLSDAAPWIDELFELLDLEHAADDRFDSYSTGMKQRLSFARGLLCKPRFLFMDEPTKGVDPVSGAALVRLMRERIIEKWQPTILITSHNLSEIEKLCGRIAMMRQGRIVAMGTLSELRAMAGSLDRYRLKICNVADEQLRSIATAVRASHPIEIRHDNGTTDVDLSFDRGSDGFSGFLRRVIESNGDVVTCSRVEESFDVVFDKLMTESSIAPQGGR